MNNMAVFDATYQTIYLIKKIDLILSNFILKNIFYHRDKNCKYYLFYYKGKYSKQLSCSSNNGIDLKHIKK